MTPRKFTMVLGVLLGLLVGGTGVGYYYAVKAVGVAKTNLATQLAAQQTAQTQLDQLATLRARYQKEIVPILPLIDATLPKTKQQSEILAQLQAIAGSSGLQISGVTLPPAVGLPTGTSQTTKIGGVLVLPISFDLVGTYAQLQTFLQNVETLNRFTNVSSLAVSSSGKGQVTYTMTVNVYIKP